MATLNEPGNFSRRPWIAGVVLTALLLSGCKVEITVPAGAGGSVITKTGTFQCLPGQICTIGVYGLSFDQDFVAAPAPGYTFEGWRKTNRGFCGNKQESCHLTTSGFAGNANLMAMLESDNVFYLEPIFKAKSVAPGSANHLLLYGGAYANAFIGCITCGRYDGDSICNAYSIYGSQYSAQSIWNKNESYGSPYSNTSPWNQYAGTPPAIYDAAGSFYGYFTANPIYPSQTTIATLVSLADTAADGRFGLDAVRDWFCE